MEWLKSWWSYLTELFQMFAQKEGNFLIVGLDNAGKSTLMSVLRNNHLKQANPTFQPVQSEVIIGNTKLKCFDMGGHPEVRSLWKQYFPPVNAIVFIVDAAERERIPEAKKELQAILADESIKKMPVLVFGNKIDVQTAMSEDELRYSLGLMGTTTGKAKGTKMEGIRPLELFVGSVLYRSGYGEALKWLISYI